MLTIFYIVHTCFGIIVRHLQEYDTTTSINIKNTYIDSTTLVSLLYPMLYVPRHFGVSSPKMAR
jgi:hypothetical protein